MKCVPHRSWTLITNIKNKQVAPCRGATLIPLPNPPLTNITSLTNTSAGRAIIFLIIFHPGLRPGLQMLDPVGVRKNDEVNRSSLIYITYYE